MALRYIFFITTIVVLSFALALGVKAPSFNSLVFDISNDPLAKIKRSYAKMIWKGAQKEPDYSKRFGMLKRVLEYDAGYKDVYSELCTNRSEFFKKSIASSYLERLNNTLR